MNLKTVVESVIEALKEKGLNDDAIETIIETWKSREGLEDLNISYDRQKIKTLFDVISDHFRSLEPEEIGISFAPGEEEATITEGEEEGGIEKELEELVKLLSSSDTEIISEEVEVAASAEESEDIEDEIEKELMEFAQFLEEIQKEEKETPSAPSEPSESEALLDEVETAAVKIVDEDEEAKIKDLVKELSEETTEEAPAESRPKEPLKISGLRLAAVLKDGKVEELMVFKEGESEPRLAELEKLLSSIWNLTGYEVHGYDSFHVKSGALILYGEKIEDKTYVIVAESETVGGAKFLVLALKKLFSQ